MSKTVIELQNIKRNFQVGDETVHALRGVSFSIGEGEFVTIMGTSGSGKSTLLNILGCLDTPTVGEYLLDGISVRTMSKSQRAVLRNHKIGFVFQNYNLLAKTTAVENVELPLMYNSSVSAAERRKRAIEALKAVGLGDRLEHKSNQMSGGQRQRVGIAQALLGAPPLLILDEPTVGLDPEERIHFRNLFSHAAQDRLVLLSTHIIEDVQSVCDQLVVIDRGQILFTGTPEQLIRSASGHVGVFYEREANQEDGLHITARVNTAQGVRCRAVADSLPAYAQPEEPSLEDAYLYLISGEVRR